MMHRHRLALAVLALAAVACDADTMIDPGAFTLAGPAGAVSVVAGDSTEVRLTVTRSGNFAGPVLLDFGVLPAGVTARAAPSTIAADASTSIVTVAAAASAAPGPRTITVRANAAGQPQRTLALPITITPAPGFTVAVAAPSVTVQQGQSASFDATITRVGGYTGPVTISVTGRPDGIDVSDVTTTTGTAQLTVVADGNATVGTATLTVIAHAVGFPDRTATVPLVVTAR